MQKAARYWLQDGDGYRCTLCHRRCRIPVGGRGFCGARTGGSESLIAEGYGRVTATSMDPIEKKPLYHVHPGTAVFSVGFAGCSMDCPFCQNHNIARAVPSAGTQVSPEDLVAAALDSGAGMIAYTYSEPTIHPEFLIDTAEIASRSGLLNILVSNGCVSERPARDILHVMDAANIDLKSPDPLYYEKVLKGDLELVKRFIEIALELNVWVELTTLMVTGDTDRSEAISEIVQWIAGLDTSIPLHLSAYFPTHKYSRPPTSPETLLKAAERARMHLQYVYVGNIGVENSTQCRKCSKTLVDRTGYAARSYLKSGRCPQCNEAVPGLFPETAS